MSYLFLINADFVSFLSLATAARHSFAHCSAEIERGRYFTSPVIFASLVIESEMMQGSPVACASIMVLGIPSKKDGIIKASEAERIAGTSERTPVIITLFERPSLSIVVRISSSSSPLPTSRSFAQGLSFTISAKISKRNLWFF